MADHKAPIDSELLHILKRCAELGPEALHAKHGKGIPTLYPVVLDGVEFSNKAVLAEIRENHSQASQLLPSGKLTGGFRKPNGIARALAGLRIPVRRRDTGEFLNDFSIWPDAIKRTLTYASAPETADEDREILDHAQDLAETCSDDQLERMLAEYGSADTRLTTFEVRKRNSIVRALVLKRANGRCESCEQAPFTSEKTKAPYLEVHHLYQLSDDGADHQLNMAAICPNCHRRIHHGVDGPERNDKLRYRVRTDFQSRMTLTPSHG